MKVLVLSPPLSSAGGIQRYTLGLVRALGELLGAENVRCVAIPESADQKDRGRFSASLKLRFGLQALWESLRWRPDLIVCAHLALGPVGRRLASLRRRPYWVMVYGIEAWVVLPEGRRDALRHADKVIGITDFSQQQVVRQHQVDPKRMASLPCTLDESLLQVEPAQPGARFGIPDVSPMVLTVARLAASERYKGHDVMLQALPMAVAKVPNLVYVIVGDGDDRPRLGELSRELGVDEHVVFTGEVSDADLAGLYQRSQVFAMPARTVFDDRDAKGEGFGIVFLEAMAFGKPVIGPNYGAPAEIMRDGEHGLLVDPDDAGKVADALVSLLANPEKAIAMGQTGKAWVEQQYGYDSFRERLKAILKTCNSGGLTS